MRDFELLDELLSLGVVLDGWIGISSDGKFSYGEKTQDAVAAQGARDRAQGGFARYGGTLSSYQLKEKESNQMFK